MTALDRCQARIGRARLPSRAPTHWEYPRISNEIVNSGWALLDLTLLRL